MKLRRTIIGLSALLSLSLTPLLTASAQELIDWPEHKVYTPGQWLPTIFSYGCDYTPLPDSHAVACIPTSVMPKGLVPFWGYPMHYAIFQGINDTLQMSIRVGNGTPKDYPLKGIDWSQWYNPHVMRLDAGSPADHPFRDSSQVGYRIRGWYRYNLNMWRMPPPDTLKSLENNYRLYMDIWGLPEGHFEVCLVPSPAVPNDVAAQGGGFVYEFYPAQSQADTINAYEAVFWRLFEDRNLSAADEWADQILALNSKSVPGWGLKYVIYNATGDSAHAVQALDNALNYLDTLADPLLPNAGERALHPAEKAYLIEMHAMFRHYRDAYR